jgi:hypothetical protein
MLMLKMVKLFMNKFPDADIHELVAPNLLHQVIKGVFKDHLILWVEQYLYSDSNNCPNVLYFLIVHSVASHSDQTEPKCWCM